MFATSKLSVESSLNYELFTQEFVNFKNGVKKTFNRNELLNVQLLSYVRQVNAIKPLKKVECDFDTKSHIIARWNEMVENIDTIESAPVLSLIFNPILNECIDDNNTEIGAFEQFVSIINSGQVDYRFAVFEYSTHNKLFVGFCLNNWTPELMTYDFKVDLYKDVSFSLITA